VSVLALAAVLFTCTAVLAVTGLAMRGRAQMLAYREQLADGWERALRQRESEVRRREWRLLHERGSWQ
jgi:hypothetical protein